MSSASSTSSATESESTDGGAVAPAIEIGVLEAVAGYLEGGDVASMRRAVGVGMRQINLLLSRLDERQRRWYLAVESQRFGYGADRLLFEITGLDKKTIRRGSEELAASSAE